MVRNLSIFWDELESKLNINVRPLTWPIGMGDRFKGVYNLYREKSQFVSRK